MNVDYPAGSIAAMVLECGTLEPSLEDWTETSGSGTYDESAYPPELNNKGAVDDDWTILFTSATEFTCSGLYEGSVGSGQIGTDFEPDKPEHLDALLHAPDRGVRRFLDVRRHDHLHHAPVVQGCLGQGDLGSERGR